MTEYGPGQGPEPWHPEDPLYGDVGWPGQQAPGDQRSYGDQPAYQQPRHPQHYDPHHPYGGADQQYGSGSYPQQQYDPGQYDQWGTGQQPAQGGYPDQDPYGGQGHPPDPGYGQNPAYGGQDPGYGQGPYDGGWDTGRHEHRSYGEQGPGYDEQSGYGRQQPGYGQQPGGYEEYGSGAHEAYQEPRAPQPPPGRAPRPARAGGAGTDPETGWDPGPDQGEHAFFSGADDDDDQDGIDDGALAGRGRGRRGGRGGKPKKRRSGCACLVVIAVLGGGIAGLGYLGYSFYEDHFGPAPDYEGEGIATTVSVTVPQGSGGYAIGNLLKKSGVVKSVDAFVEAQKKNPKGTTIQEGVYTLRLKMSAASAVTLMLDPKSRNNLVVNEGRRNVWIYEQIDKRLGLKAGTTQGVAKKDADHLGLPDWAKGHKDLKDPLEGFLFPSSYPVAKGMKPQDVLQRMVSRAAQEYGRQDLAAAAKRLHVDGPWQVITVASLVQAEGKTHDDFRKMSEVVYNRLDPGNTQTNQLLQFDSAFNYLKGQSKIDISESEINSNKDPYNTYTRRGLTPGPIGNPGAEALAAALKPTDDGWLYFVATDGANKTEFAKTYAEFQKLKDKFNDQAGRD